MGVFLLVPLIFSEYLFLEHFYWITSINLIQKDSIENIQDSFKDDAARRSTIAFLTLIQWKHK